MIELIHLVTAKYINLTIKCSLSHQVLCLVRFRIFCCDVFVIVKGAVADHEFRSYSYKVGGSGVPLYYQVGKEVFIKDILGHFKVIFVVGTLFPLT